MARKPITQEFYVQLVEAFRLKPGNASAAARIVGCDRDTAGKAWRFGWVNKGMVPIKDVFAAEEVAKARAKETKRAAELGERDVALAKARAEIGELLRAVRGTSLGVLGGAARMVPAIQLLGDRLRQEIEAIAKNPMIVTKVTKDAEGKVTETRERVPATEILMLLERFARVVRTASLASAAAISMERANLGLPPLKQDEPMTLEEAVREIEQAGQELERAKAAGLTVIEGGRA